MHQNYFIMECASLKGKALQQIQKGMTATFAVVQVHFWGAPRQTSRAQQLFAIGAVGYVKPCTCVTCVCCFQRSNQISLAV